MIYTQGKGITITAAELKALLVFTDAASNVDFIVTGGALVVRAGCPHTVHHVVDGWNGKSKCTDEYAWQFQAGTLRRLTKIAGKSEEIFFPVSKSGHISRYRIREIDVDDAKTANHEGSLDGHVQHQTLVPINPLPEKPVDGGASELSLDPWALKQIETVAKAVGNGKARFCIPNDPDGRTYIEIDTPTRLANGENARWIVELAREPLEADDVRSPKSGDDRQEELDLEEDDDAEDEG